MIQNDFAGTVGAASERLIVVLLAVLALGTCSSCASIEGGSPDSGREGGKTTPPVLHHHYNCGDTLLEKYAQPAVVPEGEVVEIATKGKGLAYFTVYSNFTTQTGATSPKVMHFVLGSLDDSPARAFVRGSIDAASTDETLVYLDQGFLWVSSSKPVNWGEPLPEPEYRRTLDAGEPGRPDEPTVGWSLYTLIRAQATWAGAVATEYIYWIEQRGNQQNRIVLYNLENVETRHGSTKDVDAGESAVLKKDQHARYVRGQGLKKATDTRDRYDTNFVKYVRCRVEQIREHDESARCDNHADCAP